jgi:hypothetical protein
MDRTVKVTHNKRIQPTQKSLAADAYRYATDSPQ